MPSYKYGARQIMIQGQSFVASTAANMAIGAWQYLPAVAANQAIDAAAEGIKSATLLFASSVAQANSTAAGGSAIIAATQFNSLGNSVASATFYNQAVASQAAALPIDVSSKLSGWVLSAGDSIVLYANSNTVAVPAGLPACILSATVDTVTAS